MAKGQYYHKKGLLIIQERVNSIIPPSGVGRIPSKISSNFNDFTADEWKNWTLIYSMYALYPILPDNEMKMWELFVKACTIICTRFITTENVELAHHLFVEFNRTFQELHGSDHCTINMHLHCHLKETVLNFGPIYSFWCFPYERYNGILGSYSTNNHSINIQVMRKFSFQQSLDKYLSDPEFLPDEYKDNIMTNLVSQHTNASTGSLKLQQLDFNAYKLILAQRDGAVHSNFAANVKDKLCGCIYEGAFTDLQFDLINQLYTSLYVNSSVAHVSRFCQRSSDVELYCTSENYSSSTSISKLSNCAYALNTSVTPFRSQLCSIQCYVKHAISIANGGIGTSSAHISAHIQWYEVLSEHDQKWLGETTDLWSLQLSQHCYIPVYLIQNKAAIVQTSFRLSGGIERRVILSVPIHKICNTIHHDQQ